MPKRPKDQNLPPCTARLKEAVDALDMFRGEIGEQLGMSAGGFNNVFLRATPVSGPLARAFELEFNVSHRWILYGEEPVQADTNRLPLFGQFVVNYADEVAGAARYALARQVVGELAELRQRALSVVARTGAQGLESSPLWSSFQEDQGRSVALEQLLSAKIASVQADEIVNDAAIAQGIAFADLRDAATLLLWVKLREPRRLARWESEHSGLSQGHRSLVEDYVQDVEKMLEEGRNVFAPALYGKTLLELERGNLRLDVDAVPEKLLTLFWRGKLNVSDILSFSEV